MKQILVAIVLILVPGATCVAQVAAPSENTTAFASASEIQQRLQLAISSEDYPVTPGDLYRLSFRQADTVVTTDFLVESNYVINMKVFGSTNASGMTFAQLKPIVEKAVGVAYPRSMPSLSIYSLGIFQVYLKGETTQSQSFVAWGMSHLSDLLEGKLGPYSCLRNIKIISTKGVEREYDLLQFQRLGLVDQNPYMKSGDTVVISASERTVEIAGEVKCPGKYQLLHSDKFNELVNIFGGGLTAAAATTQVRVDRISGEKPRTLYTSFDEKTSSEYPLEDGDTVTISSKITTLPVVFFEGAVTPEMPQGSVASQTAQAQTQAQAPTIGYYRIPYAFRQGETLRSALEAQRKSISPMANLPGSFLIREGISEPVPVDLAVLLSGAGATSDMPLQPHDRIVIPVLRFSVFVSGAVEKSGTYQYAPDQTYQYYVTLAGGNTQEAPERISVTDVSGKTRDQRDAIHPEDQIFVMPETVKVQGAVFTPGSFSYRQGLPASYYVNLAGGIDPERNNDGEIKVLDSAGKARKTGESVMPGDLVYAPNKSFTYSLTKYGPLVATVLSLVIDSVVIFSNWNR